MRRLFGGVQRRRREVVLEKVHGCLLDVGCGDNRIVREHGEEVGADVHKRGDVDVLIEDAACLPFRDRSFDTVSFVACLNHIPSRAMALREARRVLRDGGALLITRIPPGISRVWHRVIRRWDPDQQERSVKPGEVWGLRPPEIRDPLEAAGFVLLERRRFDLGLSSLYVAQKDTSRPG